MVDGALRRRATDGKSGPHVCLSVADLGTGIPPALLEKVFDPYFTTKEIGKGTGLGLSTVYGIVKGHEGFVTIESELGRGTTFHIYLPVLTEVPVRGGAGMAEVVPPRGQGETVLVIENDVGVRGLMQSLLEHHGYEAMIAGDGPEALDLLRNHSGPVAVVITNLVMPLMNGPEVIAAVRSLNPAPLIIALRGVGKTGGFPDNFDPLSVAALLSKPIEFTQLLGALRKVLGTRGDRP
jgi:CheY-like chemotaxis protein